ncbi:sigma-54-dependent Fis family transcriptional regulator [candidate division KSB1 bacterium]|nr:sigma-54-dependent Fis family transcriptional regulator [candidate division KSB1 bacterium]
MKILLIEDEKIMRVTLTDAIRKKGYQVTACDTGLQGLDVFKKENFDVVITDLKLPKISGIEVLKTVRQLNNNVYVILMTAFGSVNSAVEALKMGAYDYLTKPFSHDELLLTLKKLEEHLKIVEENIRLKDEIRSSKKIQFIGSSPVARKIYEIIETVADSDHTVLIEGESGTGKEVVANLLHHNSSRRDGPFIKLNCASLSESLLESELFGHEKGAFTGAIKTKKGRFERAHEGTIFLDDIDDMPLSMQVNLLRVIQEREIERVGGSKVIPIDVRVICATKLNLKDKIKAGEFREDLYYRLNVVPIFLPALRERKEDIPLLIEYFIKKHGMQSQTPLVSKETMKLLLDYNWPGNIRELENIVERMIALSKSNSIGENELPDILTQTFNGNNDFVNWDYLGENFSGMEKIVAQFEQKLLNWALRQTDFNQTEAAQLLQLNRTTMRSKLEKYGMIKNEE